MRMASSVKYEGLLIKCQPDDLSMVAEHDACFAGGLRGRGLKCTFFFILLCMPVEYAICCMHYISVTYTTIAKIRLSMLC